MDNSFLNRVISSFLDGMSPDKLVAGFFYALIGVFISMLIDGATRDPMKSGTPIHWSWRVFFCDKVPRFLRAVALTLLIIFVSIRFMDKILGEFSMLYSLLIGWGFDDVKAKWKMIKETLFKSNKNS